MFGECSSGGGDDWVVEGVCVFSAGQDGAEAQASLQDSPPKDSTRLSSVIRAVGSWHKSACDSMHETY
jgi:hypothetical protein